MRRYYFYLLGFVLMTSLVICAEIPDDVEIAAKQHLTRYLGQAPASVDPQLFDSVAEVHLVWDLFEGLTSLDPEGNVVSGVAESWRVESSRVYRFTLREDARWSDGSPVTAEDFVFAWQRGVDPKLGGMYAFYFRFTHIKNADPILLGKKPPSTLGVHAISARELVVELEQSVPYFARMLAHPLMFPVPKKQVQALGKSWASSGKMVSNGAYQLVASDNKSWRLKRNSHYWNDSETIIDSIDYLVETSRDRQLKGYASGRAELLDEIPEGQFKTLQTIYPNELKSYDLLGVNYLMFNVKHSPFDNVNIRRALALALDRQQLTSTILTQGQSPAYTFTPPTMSGFIPPTLSWEKQSQSQRNQQAQQLLAQSGWPKDKPLRFSLTYNDKPINRVLIHAIASQWAQVLGAEVKLIEKSWKNYLTDLEQGNFDAIRMGWIADYAEPSAMLSIFSCNSGENFTGWCSNAYDNLLRKSSQQFGGRIRARFYGRAEALLHQESPMTPLYYYSVARLVKPYVGGYQNNVLDIHLSKDLYLKKH